MLVINPLGAILTQARKALLDSRARPRPPGARRYARLLIPLGIIAGLFALGAVVLQPRGPADLGEAVAMSAAETSDRAASSRPRTSACAPASPRSRPSSWRCRRATNAVVAEWQERAYWLDRWHLDLNALMRRPAPPSCARGCARCARSCARRSSGPSGAARERDS